MALTHALSTNNYGPFRLIVATSAANGTHTTLASALADASVGDTVDLRDSVTENVTIPPGVNITAGGPGTLNTPTITGTITMSGAGTSTISGCRLQTNSAALLAVTGTAASILNLNNCYLNISNNTGITFSSSDANSTINLFSCYGDIGTTGIAIFTHTSAGSINFYHSHILNTGASTTASTCASGNVTLHWTEVKNPITTSSTGGIGVYNSIINTGALNVTALTAGGSGSSGSTGSTYFGGSASAISIGGTLSIASCSISSSNTNAITGAGTISPTGLSFTGTSSTINTTTQTPTYISLGKYKASGQPLVFASKSANSTNATGDNTVVTVIFDTVIKDLNSNYNSGTGIFTAPGTGIYSVNATVQVGGLTTAFTNSSIRFVATSRTLFFDQVNIGAVMNVNSVYDLHGSSLIDMTAGDTLTIQVAVSNSTKIISVNGNANLNTFVSIMLVS